MNPFLAFLQWLRSLGQQPQPPQDDRRFLVEWIGRVEDRDGSCIARVNGDGTGLTALTRQGVWRDWSPRPSPNGEILFNRDAKGHRGSTTSSVWIRGIGGNERCIVSLTEGINDAGWQEIGHHEWSPDGKYLYFSASGKTETFSLWRCNADGTNPIQLTSGTKLDADPSVCPDGSLLFARRDNFWSQSQEIWHRALDGTETQLTHDTTDRQAEWDIFASPDQERIAYLRQTSEFGVSPWENWIADIDGTNARRIAVNVGVPRWANNDQIVTTHLGPWGYEPILVDVDHPTTRRPIIKSTPDAKFRNPILIP